jgi:hypothetical protein
LQYVAGYLTNPEEDLAAISMKAILDVARKIEDMAAYQPKESITVKIGEAPEN